MPLRKLVVLLHAGLEDPTDMDDLTDAPCFGSNIAPLADLGLVPGLDLPETIPLLPERSLRLGILGDLLPPDRSGNEEIEEILRERDLGNPGAMLALQPRTAGRGSARIIIRVVKRMPFL
eukprot:6495116-Alexandrium_andersonii.AAC.1